MSTAIALIMLVLYVRGGFGMMWLTGFIALNLAMMFLWPKISKYYYLFLAFLTLEESVMGTLFLVSSAAFTPSRAGDAANLARLTPLLRPSFGQCCFFYSHCYAPKEHWVSYSRKSAGTASWGIGEITQIFRHL